MSDLGNDQHAVARHEAAHAVTAVAQGGTEIQARVRPANADGWKGDSTFPDHLPLCSERLVVTLVGLVAQVKLGEVNDPEGHESDVARACTTAIELAANDDPDVTVTEVQRVTKIVLAATVATRFLESVWPVVLSVADTLIERSPDYVVVNQLVQVEDLKAGYTAAKQGLVAAE